MEKLAMFVKKYSLAIIITVIVLTLVMGYYAFQIDIKAGIKDMLPENNDVLKTYNRVTATFGSMAYALIMLEDSDILDKATLKKIDYMTEELKGIEGIKNV